MNRVTIWGLAMLGLAPALGGAGCSRGAPADAHGDKARPGFTAEEPHVNSGAGGIGSRPTGTQGSQPADVPPAR